MCKEFTGDRWIPAQMASNAENISIWWRHHEQQENGECRGHQGVPSARHYNVRQLFHEILQAMGPFANMV